MAKVKLLNFLPTLATLDGDENKSACRKKRNKAGNNRYKLKRGGKLTKW